ncbi:hypothetical protein ACFV3R_06590 [Streptomyces sp. NPDC059740]|uniref:hypothetical protein n=1 Tax=Streptomyces sp. NPDC059740 TaxID=3346926 RepID=UPI00365A7658
MTTRPYPGHGPQDAEQGPPRASVGGRRVVAEGVLSALRPNPHTPTVAGITPGLTVRGLDRGQFPAADWLCACGHHERARGRRAVADLTTRVAVGHCPHQHTTPAVERRAAA